MPLSAQKNRQPARSRRNASGPQDRQAASALWGGRFSTAAAQRLVRFSESVSYDWRLYAHDIRGSLAHAAMLKKIGVLKSRELADITRGLRQIQAEIEAGKFSWDIEKEDVHMNIESVLTKRYPAGAKLHTGRSRNDQVATDMRLWLKDEITANIASLRALQRALVTWAARDQSIVIPGYTHLQRAQPVLLAHHLLAYVEMFDRDAARLSEARTRMDVLPLGSGAIAGSTLPLDRAFVARQLGFASVSQNSMDAVSDRDFIIEYNAAAALVAMHLSRFSEDLILWSSAEFNFIRISDAYTTGSSLMPQKKNPDVCELTRGKSARVLGNLVALLTLLKGLPMTYNRDLQEDKQRLFDTADTMRDCLLINAEMIPGIRVNPQACAAAAADPLLLATDLADWLVRKGVPFRQAHHLVGSAVALAEKKKVPISSLSVRELQEIAPIFDASALKVFHISRALQARSMVGAPQPAQVDRQIKLWQKKLGR
jgi:argininosuccinate lyase